MAIRWICNVREWPIAILELPPGADARDVDQDSFYEHVEGLLAKGQRFATMHDVRWAGRLDPVRRKKFADWVRAKTPELRPKLIAHAAVVLSGFQQGVITALLWVFEAPAPMKVFTDPNDARKWLRERIAASP
jgi:hypothetical protein